MPEVHYRTHEGKGCGPAQERQGGKATHLQKTDPHASGRGEHTRVHLRGEVQELRGVQG